MKFGELRIQDRAWRRRIGCGSEWNRL